MKFIITYDVQNDKRRKKISDELEAFGTRVNYSVHTTDSKVCL